MIVTGIRGFKNLGNTCYMNSTLQALLSSTLFNTVLVIYIQNNPNCIENLNPLMLGYYKLMKDMVDGDRMYSLEIFKKILDKENPYFRGKSQHDSNELMVYLINEFCNNKQDNELSNLVKNICFGRYKQYIKCFECNKIKIDYFNFLDVQLPIPNKNNPDLEDCFKHFAKFDTLDADNKWECPNCKKKVVAYKKMELDTVPKLAIFTFNRFKHIQKNNTPVRIYQHIKLEDKKLKLIATVNHYGGTHGGHYVAYVSRGDKWFKANDSHIGSASCDMILNDPSVYMTLYQIE